MKAKTNTNKKSSARKKLIPAAGSLMISAAMLSTSTYAWFTMSREVEVKNIQMTATVPEDLQISLGKLANGDGTAASEGDVALAYSTGILAGSASDLGAAAPENSWDWSNSVDISKYYAFGRLIPASSDTGEKIFYTPDANGVGKTVKEEGSYYQASNGLTAYGTSPTVGTDANKTLTYAEASANATSARATLHAYTAKTGDAVASGDTWSTSYTQATDWKTTGDDGYYVDIPVWIRSSSNSAVTISVDGYVLPGSVAAAGNTATELELYKAVRVAILNGATVAENGTTGAVAATIGQPTNSTSSILPLKDAWDSTAAAGKGSTFDTDGKYTSIVSKADVFSSSNPSILDSLNLSTTGRTVNDITYADGKLYGVTSSATAASTGADTVTKYYQGTYAEYSAYDTSTAIATIEGSTTDKQYGNAKKLIIRVWLDGEDGECWNDNAGQDWAISLKFTKL